MKRVNKRGQVTIFIIAGIVLVILAVLFFVFRQGIVPTINQKPEVNPDKDFSSCIQDKVQETVKLISEQGGYVSNKLNLTFQFVGEEQGDISYLCYQQNYYVSCVISGIYHGDLHAGNILFSKVNGVPKIHVFDVGITYHIDDQKSKKIALIYCRLIELILTGIIEILDYEEIGEAIEHFVDANEHSGREKLGELCAGLMINIAGSCSTVNKLYNSAVSSSTADAITAITDKLNLTATARQVLISWTMGSGVLTLLVNGNEKEISKCIVDEYVRLSTFCNSLQ